MKSTENVLSDIAIQRATTNGALVLHHKSPRPFVSDSSFAYAHFLISASQPQHTRPAEKGRGSPVVGLKYGGIFVSPRLRRFTPCIVVDEPIR